MSHPSPPARPTSNPDTASQDRRKPWSTSDLEGVLNGSSDPRLVREADRKGLSMTAFGAMQAAVSSAALMPLLNLLEPPEEGESKIDLVIGLLEKMLESQARIEARLAALDSPTGASRQTSRP